MNFLQRIGLRKPKEHLCIYREVRLPIYGQRLRILVQNDYQKAWADLFSELTWQPGSNAIGSALFNPKTAIAYIAIREDSTPGVLAHEAAHITHRVMSYVGIEHVADNDEAECYLLTWIVDELDRVRRKQKRLTSRVH